MYCIIRLVQVWSNDICGCRCDDSIVNDCTQLKMGIDVHCQCVDVQAIRDYRTGKNKLQKQSKVAFDIFLSIQITKEHLQASLAHMIIYLYSTIHLIVLHYCF